MPVARRDRAPRMLRLTGHIRTPALVDENEVVAGSAAILAHLERRFPEPRLEPDAPIERERAHAIARQFDDEIGPAIHFRTTEIALYHALGKLPEPRFTHEFF